VGGVPVQELNRLELDFLRRCDFSLMLSPDELLECGEMLVAFSISPRSSVTTRRSSFSSKGLEGTLMGSNTAVVEQVSDSPVVEATSTAEETTPTVVTNAVGEHQMTLMMKLARNRQTVLIRNGRNGVMTQVRFPSIYSPYHVEARPKPIRNISNTIKRGNFLSKRISKHRPHCVFPTPKCSTIHHCKKPFCPKCRKRT
jgi:hypothetical protein